MKVLPMKAVFPRFLAVTATTMVPSTIWATTLSFGLLHRTVVTLRGTGVWVAVVQRWPATATISRSGSLFGLFGIINVCLFDNLSI